jgi:hypothetical protein
VKLSDLVEQLETAVANLQVACPQVNIIIVATDDEPFHPVGCSPGSQASTGNEYTIFRNTPMSEDQCVDFLGRALTMAGLGKGLFVKVKR